MATHNDTSKLVSYNAGSFPTWETPSASSATSCAPSRTPSTRIIQVMKSLEARMNTANLP
jgi:hypothetical protein